MNHQQDLTDMKETASAMQEAFLDKVAEISNKELLVEQMDQVRLETVRKPLIHPQAVIAPTAEIHPTAVIGARVVIGEGVKIGPYCIIGMPAEWKGMEGKDFGVQIMRDTVLTGMVTVDSGAERPTLISNNCYLMKHSHVGHDCYIGGLTVISCGAKIGGHSVVGINCNIGLNAVIHQRQSIEDGCMIGMGSVVTRKLVTKPFFKYAGNPARELGPNIKSA